MDFRRLYAVGYTTANTSGRNTRTQLSDELNTTGIYSIVRHPLYLGIFFYVVEHAMQYVDRARPRTLDDKVIETVKSLSSERNMYIWDRAKYKSLIRDFEGYIDSDIYKARG